MIHDPYSRDPYAEDSYGGGALNAPRAPWAYQWRELEPHSRWMWFEWLWTWVCGMRERYQLPLRSQWWRHDISVEALAALAMLVLSYDHGEIDDPAGKLGLLFDLPRIGELLREGLDPFSPIRDRESFEQYLEEIGAEPPVELVESGDDTFDDDFYDPNQFKSVAGWHGSSYDALEFESTPTWTATGSGLTFAYCRHENCVGW